MLIFFFERRTSLLPAQLPPTVGQEIFGFHLAVLHPRFVPKEARGGPERQPPIRALSCDSSPRPSQSAYGSRMAWMFRRALSDRWKSSCSPGEGFVYDPQSRLFPPPRLKAQASSSAKVDEVRM